MKKKLGPIYLPLTLGLALLACSLLPNSGAPTDSGGPDAAPGTSTPASAQQDASEPPTDLDCVAMELPCTPRDVDPEVVMRSSEIQESMLEKLETGVSIESVVAELETMDEVRLVLSNFYGYVFMLEGGLMMGYYDTNLAYARDELTGPSGAAQIIAPPRPLHARPLPDIVGNDTDRENDERIKRALVLSPFDFEYQLPDAGSGTAATLEGIPDYTGQVDFFRDDEVTISTFAGWSQYDFVLYNGHSGMFDGRDRHSGAQTRVMILTTGVEVASQSACDVLKSEYDDLGGVFCLNIRVRVPGSNGEAVDVVKSYYAIMPQFLSRHGSANLEKSVIIINSCQSFSGDSFKNTLAGPGSVFFGWTQSVIGPFADPAVETLVFELAKGFKSEKAHSRLCSGSPGCVDPNGARLERGGPPDDLRIRELAMFLHPITKEPLTHEDRIYIQGYPQDNETDRMPFFVEILGIEATDPLEKFTLSFEINGEQVAETWSLADPSSFEKWIQVDDDTFRVFDWITLPSDFVQGQTLQLRAILDLEEGGKSKSVLVAARAANPLFSIRSNFLVEKGGQKIGGTVVAEIPLSLKEILEDKVIFESRDQEGLLKYDSYYIEDLACGVVEPKTRAGTLNIVEAVFTRASITNTGFWLPSSFVFFPAGDNAEWIEATCNGTDVTTPETNQWFATFQILGEGRFVENGVLINEWVEGTGDAIAQFFTEFSTDGVSGDYLLSLR
jgi:hypothetical protein